MKELAHILHIVKYIFEAPWELPPLSRKKDPVVAGILAFLFGPVGSSIYFRSWVDFFIPIILWLLLYIVGLGTGFLGTLLGVAYATYYAVIRANTSNKKLDRIEQGFLTDNSTTANNSDCHHSSGSSPLSENVSVQTLPPIPLPSKLVYLVIDNEPKGPFSENEISQMMQSGRISKATLFWQEGMPQWKSLGSRTVS